MTTDKIMRAPNWGALESVFWLSLGDTGEAASSLLKDAERQFIAALNGSSDKDKITTGTDLVSIASWCDRKGIAYLSILEDKGIWYKRAQALIKPDNKQIDWATLNKESYTELLTTASAKLPGLLTDTGELSENFKALLQGYHNANNPMTARTTEEDKELEEANNILSDLRAVQSGTRITASSHPDLFKGLHQYYSEEIWEYVDDEGQSIRASTNLKELANQKRVKYYEPRAREAFERGKIQAKQKLLDAVHGPLLEASPITEAMADEWAEKRVRIDKTAGQEMDAASNLQSPDANNRAERILGSNDLLAKTKEYYRLVSGKVTPIRFYRDYGKGGARAHAYSDPDHQNHYKLNVGANINKTTLFHELAHYIESDRILAAASRHFRDSRAISKRVKKLSTITGNSGYKAQEKALEDHWISPYVGKIYEHGSTEVASMALQHLARAEDIISLAIKDPQMLAYALALAVKQGVPEGRLSLENLEEQAMANEDAGLDDLQDRREAYNNLVNTLASQTKWVKDGWRWLRADKAGDYFTQYRRTRTYNVDGQTVANKGNAIELYVRQKLAKYYGMNIGRNIFMNIPENYKASDVITWEAL